MSSLSSDSQDRLAAAWPSEAQQAEPNSSSSCRWRAMKKTRKVVVKSGDRIDRPHREQATRRRIRPVCSSSRIGRALRRGQQEEELTMSSRLAGKMNSKRRRPTSTCITLLMLAGVFPLAMLPAATQHLVAAATFADSMLMAPNGPIEDPLHQLQFETSPQEHQVAPPGGGHLTNPPTSQHLPQASALMAAQNNQQQQQQQQQGPPKALIRTVNPGDRVNIPCSLANMGGSIQFAKDDQPIVLDSGCAHCQLDISNDGQASLTINRVSQRDQGHWQCWRLDAQGKVKQKIPIVQLAVTNSPELPILVVNDKELLGGNNLDATITIKENELVVFKCVIRGAATPVDYVHWYLDSSTNVTQRSELRMEYSAEENNYLIQSVLKLNATKGMNMKSISCLSNHQLWLTPMTVTALMNVLYEPSFTISREPGFGVPVSEGMSVTLKCEIDSNPSSSPVWIKDADNKTSSTATNLAGQNLDNNQHQQQQQQQQQQQRDSNGAITAEPIVLDTLEDGSVVFQPARQSDSGWYRCKTENKYGNFSSFGYYLNVRPAGTTSEHQSPKQHSHHQQAAAGFQRHRPPNQPLGHHHHQANQLPLALPPPPPPPHQMALQDHMAGSQVTRSQLANDQPQVFQANQQQQLASLQQAQQSAEERCRGGASSKLDGSPDIKTPVLNIQTQLGRQLTLPLRFCCQPGPARVFWIHRHLAMIPGRMFGPYITRDVYPAYNSPYCYETTFEIEQVKPEDIGTVYVFVTNEKGHAGAQINIQLARQTTTSTLGHSTDSLYNQISASSNSAHLGSRFVQSSGSSSTTVPIGFTQLALLAMVAVLVGATTSLTHLRAVQTINKVHYATELRGTSLRQLQPPIKSQRQETEGTGNPTGIR